MLAGNNSKPSFPYLGYLESGVEPADAALKMCSKLKL